MTRVYVMKWRDIDPIDATAISLPWDGIEGPMNENGDRCPWPWHPQEVVDVPPGEGYGCPYCGGTVVAGMEHPDYSGTDEGYNVFQL